MTHLGNGSIKGRLLKKQRLLQSFSLAHALKGLPPSNTFMWPPPHLQPPPLSLTTSKISSPPPQTAPNCGLLLAARLVSISAHQSWKATYFIIILPPTTSASANLVHYTSGIVMGSTTHFRIRYGRSGLKPPHHTRAKSRDHEIVGARKRVSEGRPKTASKVV